MILLALNEREKIGDTCIAEHIALAHAQMPSLTQPYFAVSLLPADFPWDAEHNLVRIIIMILLPTIPGAKTVQVLHDVMRKLADEQIVATLQEKDCTPETIRNLLFPSH